MRRVESLPKLRGPAERGTAVMKMITAIVNKEDSKNVCNELIKAGFSVTRLSTTGGFLMAGNMTLMIGTDDEKVDECIGLISKCCKQRTEVVPSTASYASAWPLRIRCRSPWAAPPSL